MKIKSYLLSALLSAMPFSAAAQDVPQTGPSSKNVTFTDLINRLVDKGAKDPKVVQLTQAQIGLLSRITLYKDRQYPNMYYYTPPFTVAHGGPDLYTEDFNSVAFSALKGITDQVLGQLNPLQPLSGYAKTGVFGVENKVEWGEEHSRPVEDNKPLDPERTAVIAQERIQNSPGFSKESFVDKVKFAASAIGWPVAEDLTNFDKALEQYSQMMATGPVLTITVPVAFGMNTETMEAFNVLRHGLPEVTFQEIEMDPIWHLRTLPYISDRVAETKDSETDTFAANLKIDNGIIVNRGNVSIGSAGGNMILPITYAGSIRFGYGVPNELDVLAEDSRQNLSYLLPGFLVQEQEIDIAFKGQAVCEFKAQVSLERTVDLTKIEGKIVDLNNNGGDTSQALLEVNDCVVYDELGNVADPKDREVAKIIESVKAKHIADNLSVFQAAVSTKEAILAKALADEKYWESLPMPAELRKTQTQEKFQQCVVSERKGDCIDHSDGGWGRKRKCTAWQMVPFDDCKEAFRWIDTYVLDPVKIAYFKSEADYNKVFNQTQTYPIGTISAEKVKFPLQATNAACIARKKFTSGSGIVSFSRQGCNGGQSNGAQLDKSVDILYEKDKPVLGGPGKFKL